jgi:hypothetical protein
VDIHGISFDVYTWYIRCISVDIPSFIFPDFLAGPCCWSQSMRTRVLVIKIGLFHAPPWQLCLGKRWPTKGSLLLSRCRGRRWRLALRGAAGCLRGGRLGGLVLITICPYASLSPPPSPPLSLPPSAAAAAAAAAAARASFLAVSCSLIYFLVSVGADGAGPSGLVRSLMYQTRTSWRSVCHVSSDVHSRSDIARS